MTLITTNNHYPDRKILAYMVRPCDQSELKTASQTSFYALVQEWANFLCGGPYLKKMYGGPQLKNLPFFSL